MLDVGRWTLDVGCWMLDVGCWMLALLDSQSHTHRPPTPSLLDRRTALIVCGVAAVHLGLTAAGLPTWVCPFQAALGLPCPGCGLSRATLALLAGDWKRAVHLHAFAPLVVLGLPVLAALAILPSERRARVAARWSAIDRHWHLGWLLLATLLAYWIYRLTLDSSAFVPHNA